MGQTHHANIFIGKRMIVGICSECGCFVDNSDHAEFCSGCGKSFGETAKLIHDPPDISTSQATPASEEKKESRPGITAEELSPEQEKSLDKYRHTLEAEKFGSEASLADAKPASKDLPLAVWVNANRFYMEGYAAVLEFRLLNGSKKSMHKISLQASGHSIETCSDSISLAPGQTAVTKMESRTTWPGNIIVHIEIKTGGCKHRGKFELKVLARTSGPQSITFNGDLNPINASGNAHIGNGLIVENQADAMRSITVTDPNDLLQKDYPPFWVPLVLVSDSLPALPPSSPNDAHTSLTMLITSGSTPPCRLHLLSSGNVSLGRNRRENIVTRCMPRNEDNDIRSKKISTTKPHAHIKLNADGLILCDNNSKNGTAWNGVPLNEPKTLGNESGTIDLASSMKLRLNHWSGKLSKQPDIRPEMGHAGPQWQLAERHKLAAVCLERTDELSEKEKFLIVYRWADISSKPGAAITLPERLFSQGLLQVVRRGKYFWLVNRLQQNITVEDKTGRREICPRQALALSPGQCICIGRTAIQIQTKQQWGL